MSYKTWLSSLLGLKMPSSLISLGNFHKSRATVKICLFYRDFLQQFVMRYEAQIEVYLRIEGGKENEKP